MDTKVTIVLPLSRKHFIPKIFAQLELLNCDVESTHLLVMVDGDADLINTVGVALAASKFKQKRAVPTKLGVPSMSNLKMRQHRIADIHNLAKNHLTHSNGYVFLIEDDTVFTSSSLQVLLSAYADYPHAGFISGLQVGRHGYLHIGVWTVDDIYHPSKITSIMPKKDAHLAQARIVSPIDAAGFYCMLTKVSTYTKHNFVPFENILGPDTEYGISLRQQGYQNYCIQNLQCGHMTRKETITVHNSDLVELKVIRDQSIKSGWRMTSTAYNEITQKPTT